VSGCGGGGGSAVGGSAPVTISFSVPVVQLDPGLTPGEQHMLAMQDDVASQLQRYSAILSGLLIPDATAAPAPAGLASVKVTITGPGMTAIINTFAVSPGQTVTHTFSVPAGPNRNFLIQAFNGAGGTGQILFSGNTLVASLQDGVPVTLSIPMVATVDTIPPVITLLGASPVTVAQNSAYTDAGATASDNMDGNITANIVTVNPVNTAVVGTYTVTYNVTDAAGNAATQVVRTVNVTDQTAPVITLVGVSPVTVPQGSVYTDAGASAMDNVDGNITASIVTVNPVNTAVVGTYTVTYNVTDAAGNAATQLTRTVNVVAPSLTVNTTADTVDANIGDTICADAGGFCSLRAAVQEANARAGADTITLPAGTYTLAIAGVPENVAATGDLDITDALTINGAGASTTIIDGASIDRVFFVHGVTVAIDGVTIQNGRSLASDVSSGGGGILLVNGVATVTNSTITNNIATSSALTGVGNGGGISCSWCTLTISNSTISNNSANGTAWGVGGGILKTGSPTMTITNSTISGNSTTFHGGGIYAQDNGVTTITNSTITNNSAGVSSGGIYLRVNGGANGIQLKNTIVSNLQAGLNCGSNGGMITDQGWNIASDNSCNLIQATSLAATNPLLGPLAYNGGPTKTHALLAGSPAINAGNTATAPTTDQRSKPRNGIADIGAYEYWLNGPPGNSAPVFTGTPAISFVQLLFVGTQATLTGLGTSDADGDAVTLSYQWQANGVPINGATAATYTPVAADLGKTITCVITASDGTHAANAATVATTAGMVVQ